MKSDEELMASYVAGDAAAFRELFRRHAPALLRTLGRGLWRPDDASDLVQQTFLQLHRGRRDYELGRSLRPWLYTIAFNVKREYFRRTKRRPETPLDLDGRHDPAVGPRGADRSDAQGEVAFALARLPEDQRDVIALHWLGGVPLPEVAEIVGASLSAVKVRAHRGYAAMRHVLDPAGNPKAR